MKQMIYTPNRNDKGEILATGDLLKVFVFMLLVMEHIRVLM